MTDEIHFGDRTAGCRLLDSPQTFEAMLVDAAPVAVVACGADGELRTVNAAARSLLALADRVLELVDGRLV